ncbi:iron siderophore-binding protein [Niallia circulans]|jgi:iron complex transport system substrate-binding protein|uniref:ABC transporter substrate-binding protein n=1 Tax=Niallia TaxID=2837506 RepID=UPI00077C2022|nr:iron-siderophore ABC transporter substrate-binding protein [Niallia circulans]MCM2982354.1 iron-siderophore ABC transporter substrate-binding protein [Niallia circulans]MDR4318160.1 iron-siderophore ABC transporter substrate-binding protein [Niallia circulans]MED3837521.1 iron-siderophore ABC transporter substrate-binding protein [Niallia circulans]MED4245054.1 iron-siderophore ABC transporter substrate-binding protein [Niallia circulans]MED4247756.1 iron-siderophore ABC transporter substra
MLTYFQQKRFTPMLVSLLVIIFVVLAGCGNNEKEVSGNKETSSDTNTSDNKPYTIEHAMGKTEIKGTPKRVVVLTNEGTEALLALGIKPVGAVQSWLGNPWYDHIKKDMDGVEVVGVEHEVNLEKIASLKPDLIIGTKIRQEAIYDKLRAIAPTVFSETLRGDWKDNFELYAKALNKEEEGKKVLSAFADHVAEVKAKLGDKVNQEVSVVRFMAGTSRIYYTDSFSGVILDELGFKRAEQQKSLFTADNQLGNLAIEVGKEAIPKMDADILFYFTYAPQDDQKALDTAKEWTSDSLWKNLDVVKKGNAYEVSDAVWNTAGGVIAANQMLDELEEIMLNK